MNEIEKLKQELSDVIAKFNERIDALAKKQTFEVGKWYIDKNGEALIFNTGDKATNYGFRNNGGWGIGYLLINQKCQNFMPASDEEVFEALKKEAERRGFKEGVNLKVNFKYLGHDHFDEIIKSEKGFRFSGDELSLHGRIILRDGKWAEIVKDEPIKVGGYEVIKKNKYICIGCKRFWRSEVESISRLMSEYGFKTVSFDGAEVSLETINKILAL